MTRTWAARCADAVSCLGLGRVFTAMMTGNTVLLVLAIGQGDRLAVLRSALASTGFSVGAAMGAVLVARDFKAIGVDVLRRVSMSDGMRAELGILRPAARIKAALGRWRPARVEAVSCR